MVDLTALPLWTNLLLFAAAAAAVWMSGARLAAYADGISKRTGIGQAVVGVVLLAGVTSLPEIAVTATAALDGLADIAVNNLFGSIAVQVVMLAVVDFLIGRRALTAVVPEPVVLLQGSLNVILIGFAASAMVVGDFVFMGAGIWAWGCLLVYLASVAILANAEGKQPWLAARGGQVDHSIAAKKIGRPNLGEGTDAELRVLYMKTGVAAAIIFVAGFMLAQTGEAIAQQAGLGGSFVGFVLLALATSLPELSSAVSAARRGLYTLAISDIFGTNMINVALILMVDLLDGGGAVLGEMGSFAIFGALLAILLTSLFQAGLAERNDRSIFRMGYDSVLVLAVYAGGVILLYMMRPDQ